MSIRGFRQSCLYHFRFLCDEFGFAEERLPNRPMVNACQMRFASQKVRLIIEGTGYATTVDIAIGRFAPILDMPRPPDLVPIEWVKFNRRLSRAIRKYGPQYMLDDVLPQAYGTEVRAKRRAGRSTWRREMTQYQQLRWYAEMLREHCGGLLKGDFSRITRVKGMRGVYLG